MYVCMCEYLSQVYVCMSRSLTSLKCNTIHVNIYGYIIYTYLYFMCMYVLLFYIFLLIVIYKHCYMAWE